MGFRSYVRQFWGAFHASPSFTAMVFSHPAAVFWVRMEIRLLAVFRGRRQGRQPLNPARGPLAVALPNGVSLLSVGERGRAPCRRPVGTAKKSRVLRCFVLFPFFPIFRILWFKMGQHGPT